MADYVTALKVAAFAQEFDALNPEGQDLIITAASRLFVNLAEVDENFFAAATGERFKTLYGNGTAYLRLPPYVGTLGADPIVIVDDDDVEIDTDDMPEYFEQNGYLVIRGKGLGIRTAGVSSSAYKPFVGNWNEATTSWWNSPTGEFIGWPENYEITVSANWGFETVPADIQQAVIQLAIHLWRTGDAAFTAISQSGEPYTPPAIPAQAKMIAEKYKAKYAQTAVFA